MPILKVTALPQKDPSIITGALKKTCLAIAEAYGCESHQVWATWDEVKSGWYVEGDTAVNAQPGESHPPICQLLCFEGKNPECIERTLMAAASTLSESLGIPNNIFINYVEAKSGQVVAGNGVVRK